MSYLRRGRLSPFVDSGPALPDEYRHATIKFDDDETPWTIYPRTTSHGRVCIERDTLVELLAMSGFEKVINGVGYPLGPQPTRTEEAP